MIRKIAIVHTDFRLYWPSRLKRLNDFLAAKGIEFFVVEISGKGSPYSFDCDSGIDATMQWIQLYQSMGMEDIDAGDAVGKVIDKLDEINPDVVIAGPIAFPSGAASTRWCARKKRPVVVFDDARLDDVPRPFYVDWIKKQVYSLVDAMVIPASSHDSTYRYFGFHPEQLFFGVNAVDNDFFAQAAEVENKSIHEPFLDKPFFLAVGRQVGKKNWISLLNAFKRIAEQPVLDKWSLVFIGGGEEHEQLVVAAGELNGIRVHFIPFRKQADLLEYYRQASALILPSLYGETWGLVVNEAMASGLPVLVSRKCGCSDTLVRDGVNGYVFDPDNPTAIDNILLKFVSLSSVRRIEMGQASTDIIAEWGLDRFCHGMWDAVSYAYSEKKRQGSLPGQFIINFWNGRYRPT